MMFMKFLFRLFWGFNPRNPPLNTGLTAAVAQQAGSDPATTKYLLGLIC